jgi:hypothetical protein
LPTTHSDVYWCDMTLTFVETLSLYLQVAALEQILHAAFTTKHVTCLKCLLQFSRLNSMTASLSPCFQDYRMGTQPLTLLNFQGSGGIEGE